MEVYEQIGTPVLSLNLFEECYLKNKDDTWHKEKKNTLHISELILCSKRTALHTKLKKPISIVSLGTMSIGSSLHNEIQERYIWRFPFSVKEFPMQVIVLVDKKIKFKIRGKADLLDFDNSRLIDIKSSKAQAMRWIASGSKVAPPGAKKSHIMQAIVYWHIWNFKIIKDPKSKYWLKECGILYVNKDTFQDMYCPIPLDRYDSEAIFNELVQEAVGIHQAINLNDWVYLDGKWQYNKDWWLCKGYCDYVEECKNGVY